MKNQKGVSTLVGIIIIVVAIIIIFGGVFAYQYYSTGANVQTLIQGTQQNQNQQQQQQTTNQQTKSTACVPNWQCEWGLCKNGYQSQVAIDSNNCGLSTSNANIACPALAKACASATAGQTCTSDSQCSNGMQCWAVNRCGGAQPSQIKGSTGNPGTCQAALNCLEICSTPGSCPPSTTKNAQTTCVSPDYWLCSYVTSGVANNTMVCGCAPVCPKGEILFTHAGQGTWPDGSLKANFSCVETSSLPS
ncbi:MAG: hypothetical protein ABSF55_02810 [Candidatus Staskawiczbacteria bacterium]|jgi:hypothetical protein